MQSTLILRYNTHQRSLGYLQRTDQNHIPLHFVIVAAYTHTHFLRTMWVRLWDTVGVRMKFSHYRMYFSQKPALFEGRRGVKGYYTRVSGSPLIYFGSPFGRYPTFHTLTSIRRKSFSVCLKHGAAFSCCSELLYYQENFHIKKYIIFPSYLTKWLDHAVNTMQRPSKAGYNSHLYSLPLVKLFDYPFRVRPAPRHHPEL